MSERISTIGSVVPEITQFQTQVKHNLTFIILVLEIDKASNSKIVIIFALQTQQMALNISNFLTAYKTYKKYFTFPPANPPTTAVITPTVFTSSVLMRTTLGTFTPFR